jgi:DNA primase
VALIAEYVSLKQAGRSFKGLCPFHGEKTPSFVVNPERGSWHCFGCGVGGDLFSFVEKIENVSFVEAKERLARRAGVEFRRPGETRERASEMERLLRVNALAERFFRRELEQSPAVVGYLTGRGLSLPTIEAFRLGFAPPGWDRLTSFLRRQGVSFEDAERAGLILQNERGYRDRFVNRVIFPIFKHTDRIEKDERTVIGFGGRALGDVQPKYLNSPETPTFRKGRALYGLDWARPAIAERGHALAVEGYMDLIACHQAGFTQAIATLGTALTAEHVGVLKRYTNRLILAYDGDSAGLNATMRSGLMFEAEDVEVRVIDLPAGQDPDTFIAGRGRQAFQSLIDTALPLLRFRLAQARRKYDFRSQEQRDAYVEEAAATIADSTRRNLRREAQLNEFSRELAQEWYPEDIDAATHAEAEIRRAIRAAWRRGDRTASDRPTEIGRRSAGGTNDATPEGALPAPTGNARTRTAEEYLLRAGLTDADHRAALAARARSEWFSDARWRRLAELLFGSGQDAGDVVAGIHRDPELSPIASGLLVDDRRPPITTAGLEDAIRRLETPWRKARRRELEAAIGAGEISRSDAEYEEYLQLMRELGQDAKGDD